MNRRLFLAGGLLTLTGCVTSSLVDSVNRKEYRDEEERIQQFLISADSANLVILGEHYHYVMVVPAVLQQVMASPLRKQLEASFNHFTVAVDGKVSGRYRIQFISSNEAERREALAMGFKLQKNGEIVTEAWIRGQRYAVERKLENSNAKALNREYRIALRVEQPRGVKVLRYALTPVTLAADGVLMLAAIPLIPLAYLALKDQRWN